MPADPYQIRQHTESLLRWHDWPEAVEIARRLVECGSAWKWPEMTNPVHSHDVLAPSDAARWGTCYGAVAMEHYYFGPGSDTTSEYADLGTDAHTLADGCLRYVLSRPKSTPQGDDARYAEAAMYLNSQRGRTLPKGNKVDAEMVQYVGRYVRSLFGYSDARAILFETECRVRIVSEDGVYVSSGTSDCAILIADPAGYELQIHDLKYGVGVEVRAERSYQLMLYGIGRWQRLPADIAAKVKRFRLVIHQPRIKAEPDEWETTPVHLSAFLRGMTAIAEHNRKLISSAPQWVGTPSALQFLTVSDKGCRFCRNKFFCPAQITEINKIMGEKLPVFFNPNNGAAVAECYAALERIKLWSKAVNDAALTLAQAKTLPGYKAVSGRQGDRAWRDPDAVTELLLREFGRADDEICPPVLLSPAQLEKQVYLSDEAWNILNGHIVRAEGKPTVAPADDPRSEIATVDMFEDLSAAPCNIRDLL